MFTVPQPGMSVEVWDNLGSFVASGTATTTTLSLSVVHDVVVGTGVDGRIVVRMPDGTVCGDYRVPTTDSILGGDAYRVDITTVTPPGITVELGANKTSAKVSVTLGTSPSEAITFLLVNTSQVLYARLLLEDISAPSSLNLDVWLEGVARSTNITIRSGVPVTYSTSIVQLNIGLNNSVKLSGVLHKPWRSGHTLLETRALHSTWKRGSLRILPCNAIPVYQVRLVSSFTNLHAWLITSNYPYSPIDEH